MRRFASCVLPLAALAASAAPVSAQAPNVKALQDRINAIFDPPAAIKAADRTPIDLPIPKRLAFPSAAIPGSAVPTPPMPRLFVKTLRPSATSEGPPLAHHRADPETPVPIAFPEQPLVRLPSPEMETPVPFPYLALQIRDRTSIADPSLEASVAAALSPQVPVRMAPVPFSPLNLPDPFELTTQVRPRIAVDEATQPPAIHLFPPAK